MAWLLVARVLLLALLAGIVGVFVGMQRADERERRRT